MDKADDYKTNTWYKIKATTLSLQEKWPFLAQDWGPWYFSLERMHFPARLTVYFESWFNDPGWKRRRCRTEMRTLRTQEEYDYFVANIEASGPTQAPKLELIKLRIKELLVDIYEYENARVSPERHAPVQHLIDELLKISGKFHIRK